QMLADAADHLTVDERTVRRILQLERDAAGVRDDRDPEVAVAEQDLPNVVLLGARVQHGQRALPPRLVQAAAPGAAELVHLGTGKNLKSALRRYRGVHVFMSRCGGVRGMPDLRLTGESRSGSSLRSSARCRSCPNPRRRYTRPSSPS